MVSWYVRPLGACLWSRRESNQTKYLEGGNSRYRCVGVFGDSLVPRPCVGSVCAVCVLDHHSTESASSWSGWPSVSYFFCSRNGLRRVRQHHHLSSSGAPQEDRDFSHPPGGGEQTTIGRWSKFAVLIANREFGDFWTLLLNSGHTIGYCHATFATFVRFHPTS